ncbi:hypothetical protein QJS10_CPA06g00210 [Acorus calamus]|uniref:Uncharacterized protein n=1 Tax=Acorus calamus TaxID=4465 RepID=A0AAV9ELR0_ACOCL|nr:hypothetical protein QJS10_CPA06g00210 [Acorus calamus]
MWCLWTPLKILTTRSKLNGLVEDGIVTSRGGLNSRLLRTNELTCPQNANTTAKGREYQARRLAIFATLFLFE